MLKPLLPLLCALLLGACTSHEAPARVGLANPASVHCVELGGRVMLEQEPGGTVGYCHLPDGTVTEEWELYRAR
ncbi:putative hemolysin [Aeromonas crassostreae]